MSYQLKLSRRSLKSARFISRLHSTIQKALIESGKTQQQVAHELGVDRSVVNRRLKGSANLTARSISDFAYVLGKEVEINFIDPAAPKGTNWIVTAGANGPLALEAPHNRNVNIVGATPAGIESAEA
jgi:transcriptional regulator with XRE-family HTH domain